MLNVPAFRRLAVIEATSFLLLLVATVIKYAADTPIGVSILGPVHGGLFLAYVYVAMMIRDNAGWDGKETLLVLIGAVVPFGGFVIDRRLSDASAPAS